MPYQGRISAPLIARSSTISSTARAMVSYEQLREKLPSKPVIDAVIESNSDKVIASDVAARAGVSLSQARKDLTALASLSRGDISVSQDGELLYEFPSNLRGVLTQNSAKFKAIQTFEKAWPTVFWGIRVSFGVALLASVVLIFSTIFFIQSSSDNRRDDRDRGGGGGITGSFGGPMFWGPSPFDFFFYRPYGYSGYYGRDSRENDPLEMGFLESVFSYIFGDGNPNIEVEEIRLQMVAQLIRDNNGAVTAEQLAPYLDAPSPDYSTTNSAYVDESFVLPIVTQLEGEPQVTEDGDIVYVFPDLQVSAASQNFLAPKTTTDAMILRRAGLSRNASAREIKQVLDMNRIRTPRYAEKKDLLEILEASLPPMTAKEEAELVADDPSVLQERPYEFSLAPDNYKLFATGLGVVNLGGALYLGNLLRQYQLYGVQLPSFFGVVQSVYPLLLAYAVLFNVIPLARNFWIKGQNAEIQKRNSNRRKWRTALSARSGNVGRKLKAAAQFATGRKQIKADNAIFDTKQSVADLEVEKSKSEMDDFDKLLNDDSSFQ